VYVSARKPAYVNPDVTDWIGMPLLVEDTSAGCTDHGLNIGNIDVEELLTTT